MTRQKPKKEELEKLYLVDNISVKKIAKKYGIAHGTAKKWIIAYQLKYRGLRKRRIFERPKKDELQQDYLDSKMSTREMAKKYGVVKNAVIYWLKKNNISLRDNKNFNWQVIGKNAPCKKELERDYETMSLNLIAKKYGVSIEPIELLFKKYNIKKRNRSESRKLALKEGRSISWNKGRNMKDAKVAEMINHLHKAHMKNIIEFSRKQGATLKRLYAEGKIKVWNKGKKLSQEHVKKLSEAKRKLISPEYSKRMREIGLMVKTKIKDTKPERMMEELLKKEGLTDGLVKQYPLNFGDIGMIPDFAYPKNKIAIFCDGDYWHGGLHNLGKNLDKLKDGPRKDSIKKRMKKDEKEHYTLWRNGWTPLRFWQTEIENNPEKIIRDVKDNLLNENFIKKREEDRIEYLKYLNSLE
jgi:DNA mismatch endonuclease (patch repair protein)